jgi:hypothetical protein
LLRRVSATFATAKKGRDREVTTVDARTAAVAAGSIDGRPEGAPETVFTGTFEVRRQRHLAAEIEALVAVERSPQAGELATAAGGRLPT